MAKKATKKPISLANRYSRMTTSGKKRYNEGQRESSNVEDIRDPKKALAHNFRVDLDKKFIDQKNLRITNKKPVSKQYRNGKPGEELDLEIPEEKLIWNNYNYNEHKAAGGETVHQTSEEKAKPAKKFSGEMAKPSKKAIYSFFKHKITTKKGK